VNLPAPCNEAGIRAQETICKNQPESLYVKEDGSILSLQIRDRPAGTAVFFRRSIHSPGVVVTLRDRGDERDFQQKVFLVPGQNILYSSSGERNR
jgi:hypothetical protein